MHSLCKLVLPTCVPSSITCSLPFCQCPGGPHDMILLLSRLRTWPTQSTGKETR